mmetsp:Transcript_13483/g.22210  ORF Transcript_13483/g.22210 Transcript_13483/m.22210 type:complete len:212 (-) Transcript_13483:1224-1859(-)
MSTISCCAFWYLSQSFCNFAVNFCTCSSCDAHLVSSSMFSCRCCSSFSFSLSWSFFCFLSSRSFRLNSSSCSIAFSMTCLPTTIFCSICCSLPCNSPLRLCSARAALSSLWISSRNLFFSASATSRILSTSKRFLSASRLTSSFCKRNFCSIAATSSAEGPTSIIISFSTVLVTSTSLTTFSTWIFGGSFSTLTGRISPSSPISIAPSPPD